MNDNKATIIKFPEQKIVRINPELGKGDRQMRADRNLSDEITANLFTGLILDSLEQAYGIDVDNEDFAKYYSFIVALFQATMYKYHGLEHPLHEFMDNHVKVAAESEALESE